MNATHHGFRLERRALTWLYEGGQEQESEPYDDAIQEWVLRKMSRGDIFDVHGIMVDRALLDARFACVPERCSPAAARGRYRSCCADLSVILSLSEKRRLLRHGKRLGAHLSKHEASLRHKGNVDASYWIEENGAALARPHGRCAFSKIEKDGRIRCHLHAFARAQGVDKGIIQPISCGLFPLALFALTRGRVLVTVLQKSNHKLLRVLPPERFPCLADPKLPPLLDSMGATLDQLFGKGFARAVRGPYG
jgi:hypothetical protein